MPSFGERLKNSWNAFMGRDPTTKYTYEDLGPGYGYRPDRIRLSRGNERSIVTAIYNRIAMDVAAINIEHVRCDVNGNYKETINSRFNNCLTLDANKDQISTAFFMDVCMSMFDEGVVAIVPTDTISNGKTADPSKTESYDILEMRVGKITEWYPMHVKVEVYNENTGRKSELILQKSQVAIIENPLYAVMNEPNSTLQRLIRTLNNIDRTNEANASGKLDLIIQLPYVVKSQTKQEQAEKRRKMIEAQLTGSKYGIAYIDGTEHITQLNRAVENNLWTQATDLTTQLFNQLGLNQSIIDGTAEESVMVNYYSRTINPILEAITREMMRKFLSQTARSQGQAIKYFRNPFSLVPVTSLAEIADKFTRNEILSSNEIRAQIGYKPVDDPRADELRNKNITQNSEDVPISVNGQQEGADYMSGNQEQSADEDVKYYDSGFDAAQSIIDRYGKQDL